MRSQILRIGLTVILVGLLIGTFFSYKGVTQAGGDDKQAHISNGSYQEPRYKFSLIGSGENKLLEPLNMVVGPKGNIFVADKGKGQIKVYNANGKFIRNIGKKGKDVGQFLYPYGLLVTSRGELWVSDPENNTIQQFDIEGKFKKVVVTENDAIKPGLMTKDRLNKIYVSDLKGKAIIVFDETGTKKAKYPGNFFSPQGLAVSNDLKVWAGDSGTISSLKVFTNEGLLENQFQSDSEAKNYFTTVRGLAIDSKGRIYVVDSMNHKISVFNNKGKLLGKFGGAGEADYQFNFPVGIFIDENDQIFIADRLNQRVQIWGY